MGGRNQCIAAFVRTQVDELRADDVVELERGVYRTSHIALYQPDDAIARARAKPRSAQVVRVRPGAGGDRRARARPPTVHKMATDNPRSVARNMPSAPAQMLLEPELIGADERGRTSALRDP